jgi:hypothetical protein
MREQQQNHIFRPQMVPNPLNMRRNGLVPNLQKTVLQNTAGLYVFYPTLFTDNVLSLCLADCEISQDPTAVVNLAKESTDASNAKGTL